MSYFYSGYKKKKIYKQEDFSKEIPELREGVRIKSRTNKVYIAINSKDTCGCNGCELIYPKCQGFPCIKCENGKIKSFV